MALLGLLVSVLFCKTVFAVNSDTPQRQTVVYQHGDVRNCLDPKTPNIDIFEVLPGSGWDNLRNVPSGLIIAYNYSQCRTTHDGRFLVPDAVNTLAMKESSVQTFAELIDHWTNYTSSTSHGVNVDAGLNLPHVGISGHFSSDYAHVKSSQINDHSVTTRVQLRYVRYKATLQPDSALEPSFKKRLIAIAASLQMNQSTEARYLSQILIRDFGTHVITGVDAGAALIQEDQVNRHLVKKYESSKNKITAGASASFFGIVHFGASYSTQESKQFVDEYQKNRMTSKIVSHGGPLFLASNYSANDWASGVDKGLVPIDRFGDPISFLITPITLPELPVSIVNSLRSYIEKAIELYYEYNTYRGCTEMTSPNFSPLANVNDGSCKPALTNMTFGGVFQTCSQTPGSNDGNMCSDQHLSQVNPKTGKFSCPPHYQQVKLHTGSVSRSRSQHSCHSCWLFFHCCHTDYYHSGATYTMYWCAAEGSVPQDSGYLFGGLYTTHVMNPLTGGKTCPQTFYARQLSTDLFICISDDFEQGSKYAIPFAGFMSCQVGNPLALEGSKNEEVRNGVLSLAAFYRRSEPNNWPKHCPKGFSKHLAFMDEECEINYCTKTGSLSGTGLPPVRRPPFISSPAEIGIRDGDIIFDVKNQKWMINEDAEDYYKSHKDSEVSKNDGTSTGAAVGISIVATLACVALATILVVLFRRRMVSRQYSRDETAVFTGQPNYGATNTDCSDVSVQA